MVNGLIAIAAAVQAITLILILLELRKKPEPEPQLEPEPEPTPTPVAPIAEPPKPVAAMLPAVSVHASPSVDKTIWQLLKKDHGKWHFVAYVRQGSPRWQSGKKHGYALKNYLGETSEGTE